MSELLVLPEQEAGLLSRAGYREPEVPVPLDHDTGAVRVQV